MLYRRYLLLLLTLFILWINPTHSHAAQTTTVIFSLAWNPEGTLLAIGGIFDGQRALRLVDTSGKIIWQFDASSGPVGISWRPDGTQLASAGSDGYTIRDVSTGSIIVNFAQGGGASADDFVYWNPANFNQLATVVRDLVYLRDANTGQIQATLDGPGGLPDAVKSVGWSLDGSLLYTASTDSIIRVWDASTAQLVREIPLTMGVSAFAISPDTTRLAISGHDERVHIFDTHDEPYSFHWGGYHPSILEQTADIYSGTRQAHR